MVPEPVDEPECDREAIERVASVLAAARRPLIWAVEIVYWWVARNRRRISRLLFRDAAGALSDRAASEEREP